MAPGTKLCAIKLTVLAREEPRQEYRAPKTSRSWLAISTDVRGSGRHHPFCLFLAWGFLVFVGLLLRQKRAGGGLSVCPTWADQHSCSGCVPKVIFSPAMHSTWEIPWCFNTARVRQIRSARTLSRRASQDTAERVRSRHAVRPLSVGRKEAFYREAVMSHKAAVSRGGTESCSV